MHHSWLLFLVAGLLTACQNDEPTPEVDFLDQYVGSYLCEVIKKEYNTDRVLDQYLDTIRITKGDVDQLVLDQVREIPKKELMIINPPSQGRAFFAGGDAQVLFPDTMHVEIYHGPDSAYSELKGIKLLESP